MRYIDITVLCPTSASMYRKTIALNNFPLCHMDMIVSGSSPGHLPHAENAYL
jgi:hypothetical protein